jgi:hypothetical protein
MGQKISANKQEASKVFRCPRSIEPGSIIDRLCRGACLRPPCHASSLSASSSSTAAVINDDVGELASIYQSGLDMDYVSLVYAPYYLL